MKRTLHKHPTLEEYRVSPEPELIKRQAQSDTQEPEKRPSSGGSFRPVAAIIVLGLIAVLLIVGVSSWQAHKRKVAGESDTYTERSDSDNDTSAAESTDQDGQKDQDGQEDQDSQISGKTEEEIKIEKWAEIFDNYTAKTAGKESTIWLLELQELGELLEGEEGILFGESQNADDGTEELRFASRSDDAKELDLVVKDGDSVWNISVTDISGVRVVAVRHDPDKGGEAPEIVNSLVHDLFGLDPNKGIPAQIGITEEMLSDSARIEEYDYCKDYHVLDYVKYNQDTYKAYTSEYKDSNLLELDMWRSGESDPVNLDLRWDTESGNLPYLLHIEFDEDLVYSNRS